MEKYYKNLLKSCRQIWSRSNPEKKLVLKEAKLKIGDFDKFKCAICKDFFAKSDINVDHIFPIENTIPKNLEEFLESIKRLHSSHLQVVCKKCHILKTKADIFQKKHTEAIINVSSYLQSFPNLIHELPEDILQSFNSLIKKIKTSEKDKKNRYLKQLDKLKTKYL